MEEYFSYWPERYETRTEQLSASLPLFLSDVGTGVSPTVITSAYTQIMMRTLLLTNISDLAACRLHQESAEAE